MPELVRRASQLQHEHHQKSSEQTIIKFLNMCCSANHMRGFTILALLFVLLFAACAQQAAPVAPKADVSNQGEVAVEIQPAPAQLPDGADPKTVTVEITSSGFSPNSVTISAGDAVEFVNKDSAAHWPASAQHPTHSVYPESGGCIGSKFDACKGLKQGESFSFTFNEVGSWNYHDHLNARAPFFGKVIVE
jgi:plastocyanin